MAVPEARRDAPPVRGLRRPDVQLYLLSFLALYAELLCIRWMPAHVRYLSYFSNFLLMASFLGLGVGILSARRKLPLGLAAFPWILFGVALLVARAKFELKIGSAGMLYYGAGEGTFGAENALVLPAAFILVAILFVCIGRPLGVLLSTVQPPLRAYALDVGGSLSGIACFFLLSLTQQPPWVWFSGLLILALLLAGPSWTERAMMAGPVLGALAVAAIIGAPFWWSPYYKIGLSPSQGIPGGWDLNVNDSSHQAMLPADKKEPFYRVPYELFGQHAFKHALIIGAGSGSDTSIALKNGVGRVDAVEIDPVILELGRERHPDQPFSDPRVATHVNDGRNFLRNSTDKYDLIIFALPDSLTLTSQFSSLRLESFLFTEEAFREARDHLTDDGVLVLYNYYREVWLLRKLSGMMEDTFGRPPYVMSYGGWGRAGVVVDGPRLRLLLAQRPDLAHPYTEVAGASKTLAEDPNAIFLPLVGQGLLAHANPADDPDPAPPAPATDDWPLMYLRSPGIPPIYLAGLAMILVVAAALVFGLAPPEARRGFSGSMFFLGAAFMLLETRSLVTFALLFGSTWIVNSLVFFAVLCSVMLAVLLSAKFPLRPSLGLYGLLFAALLLAYLLPPDALLAIQAPLLRYALASTVAFLPVFLANLVFASAFKQTGPAAAVAFASNLIGIMVGGMLEYTALLMGYRNLLLLVILFYALSAWLLHRRRAVPLEEQVPVESLGPA